MKAKQKLQIKPFTVLVVLLSFITVVAFFCRIYFR